MNDAWGYGSSEDLGETELNGPKALREAYKAQGEVLKQIQQQLADERAERQKAQLSSVFTELGVPEASKVYQGDPDPEKAKAWVDTMRGVFGNGSVQADSPAAVQPAISNEAAAQYAQMTQAGSNGTPMGNFEAATSNVNGAGNLQDLIAAMANAQRLANE